MFRIRFISAVKELTEQARRLNFRSLETTQMLVDVVASL